MDSVDITNRDVHAAAPKTATERTTWTTRAVADTHDRVAAADAFVAAHLHRHRLRGDKWTSDGDRRSTELSGAGIRRSADDLEPLLCARPGAPTELSERTDAAGSGGMLGARDVAARVREMGGERGLHDAVYASKESVRAIGTAQVGAWQTR
jgi:hypothetical protein